VPELLQRLNQANQTLSKVLALLTNGGSGQVAITPDDLAGMLAELLRVGEWLKDRRIRENDSEVAWAIREYRGHLELLGMLMPSLHAQLLTERARLEAERSHLEAASAWAGTSRDTR
jgi:hypothetical protein